MSILNFAFAEEFQTIKIENFEIPITNYPQKTEFECDNQKDQDQYDINFEALSFSKFENKDVYVCEVLATPSLPSLVWQKIPNRKSDTRRCPFELEKLLPENHRKKEGFLVILVGEANDNSILYFIDKAQFDGDDYSVSHILYIVGSYLDHNGINYEASAQSSIAIYQLNAFQYTNNNSGSSYEVSSYFFYTNDSTKRIYPVYPITQNELKIQMDNYAQNKLFTWKFGLAYKELIPLEKTLIAKNQSWWHETTGIDYNFHYIEKPGVNLIPSQTTNGFYHVYQIDEPRFKDKQVQLNVDFGAGLQKNILLSADSETCRLRLFSEMYGTVKLGLTSQFTLGDRAEISFVTKWATLSIGNETNFTTPGPGPDGKTFFMQGHYWVEISTGNSMGIALKYNKSYTNETPAMYTFAYEGPIRRDGLFSMSLYYRINVHKRNSSDKRKNKN